MQRIKRTLPFSHPLISEISMHAYQAVTKQMCGMPFAFNCRASAFGGSIFTLSCLRQFNNKVHNALFVRSFPFYRLHVTLLNSCSSCWYLLITAGKMVSFFQLLFEEYKSCQEFEEIFCYRKKHPAKLNLLRALHDAIDFCLNALSNNAREVLKCVH